jgi:hypothetical protein
MPASTDYGAGFSPDPLAPKRIFRRRTTLIFASVLAGLAVVIGLFAGVREINNGLVGVATIVTGLAFGLYSMIIGGWPHVALDHERMAVHNSVFWFDVPYVSVVELTPTRLGLVIRTHAGKVVPVTAYASGSGRKVLGHADAAEELVRAVKERTAFVDDTAWREAPSPVRHVEVRNLIALVGALVVVVLLIVQANS